MLAIVESIPFKLIHTSKLFAVKNSSYHTNCHMDTLMSNLALKRKRHYQWWITFIVIFSCVTKDSIFDFIITSIMFINYSHWLNMFSSFENWVYSTSKNREQIFAVDTISNMFSGGFIEHNPNQHVWCVVITNWLSNWNR